MSNNKSLERYLELYSEYVTTRVAVHNYHVRFVKNLGHESYYRLRENILALPKLEQKLRHAARDAAKEQREIERREKRARIEARKAKKNKTNVDISGGDSK